MAKAWVSDLWVKDADVQLPDGTTAKVSPTAAELKAITKLPERFRTARFGKGKRWAVGWYELAGGVKKQRRKLFESKRDAEELAASLEEDIRVGRYLQPEDQDRVFREVAELWLKSKRIIKPSTYFNYRKILDAYVLPRWGDVKIGRISRAAVEEWVSALQDGTATVQFDDGYNKDQRPLGPSALKNIVRTVLGAVLNFAISQKWIAENVVREVELPKVPRTPVQETLTHEEVELMAKAAQEISGEYRDYVAVHVLTYGAPRINELLAFQAMHIDLDAHRARVEQTWTRAKDGGRTLGTPKNGDTRVIPLVDHLIPLLKPLVDGVPPTTYVFRVKDTGAPLWDRNWFNRVWVPAAKKSKLAKRYTKFSPHVLRHTGITFAIAAGADPKIVQLMAGHRSIEETMNRYGKLFPDRLEEVRKLMAEHRERSVKPRLEIVG
ncbi:site-specific integrase [Leucobacter viscericola]|uniref:Site-specific integrase n=1 Tax=Leucobacter viscericola TaxID=2714935 RepID=A0A6G7XCH5_9MICO|nr:site-specific integrase [Leucobacter viscericola]QIK62310.1 site-specific integrase [Leucobacter viscericola]